MSPQSRLINRLELIHNKAVRFIDQYYLSESSVSQHKALPNLTTLDVCCNLCRLCLFHNFQYNMPSFTLTYLTFC